MRSSSRGEPVELGGREFPYLIVDARYEKCRVDHRIVDVAVLVAVGVDEEGYRQVLAVEVAHNETELTWSGFLADLKERGLSGVRLVTSDDHAGLGQAPKEHFPGVPWQRCQRHFLENALEKAQPGRIRTWLFRIPGKLTSHSRKQYLQLGRHDPARQRLLAALRRLRRGPPALPALA